jgi:surfactin synthase thioesterase subunit
MVHSVVQVGAHLRHDYPSGVHVEVIENHRREKAHAEIVGFVDTDHDGTLSVEEKRNAHIILYGHSWGASETVMLARELEREGIPVLLTVQVDSVTKSREND